jgi:hypothetical protein
MKFSAKFDLIEIDLAAWRRQVDRVLMEALAQGIYQYLTAIMSRVPVWSGASRATFLQLASTISLVIPIEPSARGGAYSRIADGTAQGSGRLLVDTLSGRYRFEYKTTLPHLIYNEEHDANVEKSDPNVFGVLKKPGPYHFQQYGADAFLSVARAARLPSPWLTIKKQAARFGARTIG